MATSWDALASTWFRTATRIEPSPAPSELARAKQAAGVRVSVCLPALNEIETLPAICRTIHRELMETPPLVDELIVVDSGSHDGTAAVAARAGAQVYAAGDILPDHSPVTGGKGVALWKSLAVATGDVVVWIDADVENFAPHFVTNLLAPLLQDERIVLVKSFYERPLQRAGELVDDEGARVTEIGIRPLINLLYPELSGVIQPLSGECAVRREPARSLPFAPHYGVDIGLLVDVVAAYGLDAVAQVDLGRRVHRNRPTRALGRTAFEVMQTFMARLEALGRIKTAEPWNDTLVQYTSGALVDQLVTRSEAEDLPPLNAVL